MFFYRDNNDVLIVIFLHFGPKTKLYLKLKLSIVMKIFVQNIVECGYLLIENNSNQY